jgi:hypothetical protein
MLVFMDFFRKTYSQKTLLRLQGRDPIQLKKDLKGIRVKNAPSAIEKGPYITDAIVSWIKRIRRRPI